MAIRVLIVSPHFPPTNAADMQRVRLVLPYLKDAGVSATVLAVQPCCVAAPQDRWLERGLPDEVDVHRANALGLAWAKLPGMGTLSNRALLGLRRTGNQLLRNGKYDLIYFSTTQFGIYSLGPYWKRKFNVPFVMDYQDPWVSDYYRNHPHVPPPGGRLKYGVASWLSRRAEPQVLRQCSGVTSVSAAYPEQLRRRYSFLNKDWPALIEPFPGDDQDLRRVSADASISQNLFDPNDGRQHWVYVGRGGNDMHFALGQFFEALSQHLQTNPGLGTKIKIHFVGTSYAPAGQGRKTILPLAQRYGLSDVVDESTDRIPYSMTLRCLLDAHALIVPGSDDPGYTASKIYPYLMAHKPMLAIFHANSSVTRLIERVGGAVCLPFSDTDEQSLVERIKQQWFELRAYEQTVLLNLQAFEPFTAKSQAMSLVNFFRKVLTGPEATENEGSSE